MENLLNHFTIWFNSFTDADLLSLSSQDFNRIPYTSTKHIRFKDKIIPFKSCELLDENNGNDDEVTNPNQPHRTATVIILNE